jgi:hypothetical protein
MIEADACMLDGEVTEDFQYCYTDWEEGGRAKIWSECGEWECWPGNQGGGGSVCEADEDGTYWQAPDTGGDTPLLLQFSRAPVRMQAAAASFRIGEDCEQTDWPVAETPWLVLDRDGDQQISSGEELFGSETRLGAGRAHNGFEALSALDDNRDGRIDPADPAWPRLQLWSDANVDKRSAPSELLPLRARGVGALSLDYRVERRCDRRGNCELERSIFSWTGLAGEAQEGSLVDVHPRCGDLPVASHP